MRHLLAIFALAPACFVHADFIIEERVESAGGTHLNSTKIKGRKVRMDKPGEKGGATGLIDGDTGLVVTLVHRDKVALISTIEEVLVRPKQRELEEKKRAPKPSGFVLVGKERIGAWDCEIYERNRDGITHRKWVTKDIAIYPRLRKQLTSIVANVPGFKIEDMELPDHVVASG